MKVNKTYSLDVENVTMLERYCAASDTWDKRKSRSKVVNDAIRWFLTGDVAEQLHSHEALVERYRSVCIELDEYRNRDTAYKPKSNSTSWWRRLLGLN